jgi:hypothetical protein
MPIIEDLKEYAERATGLRRPGKREAPISRGPENPMPFASRTMVSSPTIRGGRSSSTGAPSNSMTATIPRP